MGVADRSLRGVADENAESICSFRMQESYVVLSRGKSCLTEIPGTSSLSISNLYIYICCSVLLDKSRLESAQTRDIAEMVGGKGVVP